MKRLSGSTRLRILAVLIVIVVLWLAVRNYNEYQTNLEENEDLVQRQKGQPVYVQVFYEALCPDSKNFILKQLQPTFKKIPKLFDIQFVPYGKATTSENPDGSLKFECQHGHIECEANIIHACSIEAIHDAKARLDMIACMIKDNMLPKEAFHRCAREHAIIDSETIQKCYSSLHGAELLKIHGIATDALRPKVSFIPTVTLDGNQYKQALILKDFFSELCKVIAGQGPMPKACEEF